MPDPRSTPRQPEVAPHILGMLFRYLKKATHAQSRLARGRRRRVQKFVHKATGTIIYIGKTKWHTQDRRWQQRCAQALRFVPRELLVNAGAPQ